MMSVVCYWTGEDLEESDVANQMNSTSTYGTLVQNMIDFAENNSFSVQKISNMDLNELFSWIDLEIPVIVLIQAWSGSIVYNWTADWSDGHWVVACGYDDQKVYFMDPWTLGRYTFIDRNEFEDRWHDVDGCCEKVWHLGLVLIKDQPPQWRPHHITYLD